MPLTREEKREKRLERIRLKKKYGIDLYGESFYEIASHIQSHREHLKQDFKKVLELSKKYKDVEADPFGTSLVHFLHNFHKLIDDLFKNAPRDSSAGDILYSQPLYYFAEVYSNEYIPADIKFELLSIINIYITILIKEVYFECYLALLKRSLKED